MLLRNSNKHTPKKQTGMPNKAKPRVQVPIMDAITYHLATDHEDRYPKQFEESCGEPYYAL